MKSKSHKGPPIRSKNGTRRTKLVTTKLTEQEIAKAHEIFGENLPRVIRAFLLGQPLPRRSRLEDDDIRMRMLALYALFKVIERIFKHLNLGDTEGALSLRPEFDSIFKNLVKLCFKNSSN